MYWFKRKYRQIKRVIDFLPIIWKGYDWDYRYALELFQHQLKRTADYIEKDGYQVGAHNKASRIRTAVELMEKVYDEEYKFEYATKIEEKYGPSEIKYESFEDEDGEYFDIFDEFTTNDYTEEELLLIREEKNTLTHESYAKHKRAHKILWKYIEHNIQRWWD